MTQKIAAVAIAFTIAIAGQGTATFNQTAVPEAAPVGIERTGG